MASLDQIDGAGLAVLARDASDDALRLAASVLRDDAANRRWRAQIGPTLTQAAVAELLGMSPQGVSKRAVAGDLLRLTHRDGRPVYPTFQFDGRGVLGGLATVLSVVGEVDDMLTATAWLTAPKPALDGVSPVEALRAGRVDAVVDAARRYAARSA